MIFPLRLRLGSFYYSMICELIYEGESVERFKIWAKNNPDKFIVLQNNRPLIRKKYLLKTKRITWKVIQGSVTNIKALEDVIAMIEYKIDPPDSYIHPKNMKKDNP